MVEPVVIEPLDAPAVWEIRTWDAAASVTSSLGADPAPGRIVRDGTRHVLRVGPLVWWVMDNLGTEAPDLPATATRADIGPGLVWTGVTGPAARTALNRMVPLDLRDAAMPDGSIATTGAGHLTVRILRMDADGAPAYRIAAPRSAAGDIAHHLEATIRALA